MNNRVYEVLDHKNYSGLTIGSRSVQSGKTFLGSQWSFGEEALNVAIKNKRCKEVTSSKVKERIENGLEIEKQVGDLESRLDSLEKKISEKENLLQESNKLLSTLLQSYQKLSQEYMDSISSGLENMDPKSKDYKALVKKGVDLSEESDLIFQDVNSFLEKSGVDDEN